MANGNKAKIDFNAKIDQFSSYVIEEIHEEKQKHKQLIDGSNFILEQFAIFVS